MIKFSSFFQLNRERRQQKNKYIRERKKGKAEKGKAGKPEQPQGGGHGVYAMRSMCYYYRCYCHGHLESIREFTRQRAL